MCIRDSHNHVNVKPESWWITKFEEYGFEYSEDYLHSIKKVSTMGTDIGVPAGWWYGREEYIKRDGLFFINKDEVE